MLGAREDCSRTSRFWAVVPLLTASASRSNVNRLQSSGLKWVTGWRKSDGHEGIAGSALRAASCLLPFSCRCAGYAVCEGSCRRPCRSSMASCAITIILSALIIAGLVSGCIGIPHRSFDTVIHTHGCGERQSEGSYKRTNCRVKHCAAETGIGHCQNLSHQELDIRYWPSSNKHFR
jgi:hypothetical protein